MIQQLWEKGEIIMRTRKRKNRRNIVRTMIVFMLAVCLAAGTVFADFSGSSPFSNTGRSSYTHNGRFSSCLVVNGVDISDWQSKNCNFAKAKNAGVDFAIMKVTGTYYGRKNLSCYNDSNFSYQYSNARANGVMTGVYVFSQAKNATEGAQEAQFAINRLRALGIGPKDLQLPVYMDYEFAGGRLGRMYGIKKADATAAAVAFCNTIKAAGYSPGIYANTSFYKSYIDMNVIAADVDIWCAQYYSRCQSDTNYSKWQYSSSAKIDGMLSYLGIKGKIDANYWYINKAVNPNPLTKICGKTTLSVADAKSPKFKIYNGSTLLKEGTDYVVGGIRNNKKGSGYAYIKGIGAYGGYALVPVKVADKTSGSAKTELNSVSANYITYASGAMSGNASTPQPAAAATTTYQKGKKYTVQTSLNIRKGPGTNYKKVKRSKLSKSMKKKCYSGKYAVLKKGKKVKCKKVSGNWMKVSGGWICCGEGSSLYVK